MELFNTRNLIGLVPMRDSNKKMFADNRLRFFGIKVWFPVL
jgi:hypothetical protein